jgi:hypothetical protein
MIVLDHDPLTDEDRTLAGPVERRILAAIDESERLAAEEDAWRRLAGEAS